MEIPNSQMVMIMLMVNQYKTFKGFIPLIATLLNVAGHSMSKLVSNHISLYKQKKASSQYQKHAL